MSLRSRVLCMETRLQFSVDLHLDHMPDHMLQWAREAFVRPPIASVFFSHDCVRYVFVARRVYQEDVAQRRCSVRMSA